MIAQTVALTLAPVAAYGIYRAVRCQVPLLSAAQFIAYYLLGMFASFVLITAGFTYTDRVIESAIYTRALDQHEFYHAQAMLLFGLFVLEATFVLMVLYSRRLHAEMAAARACIAASAA